MTESDQELYNKLAYYTLEKRDPEFIHQYIVDAYAAQHFSENTKPIRITFALIGLYLHLEKGYTGKQAQNAHIMLAKNKREWLKLIPPSDLGDIKVGDVLNVQPGIERDKMIDRWCFSVWISWKQNQQQIRDLVKEELGV